jgi:hypothetical protein
MRRGPETDNGRRRGENSASCSKSDGVDAYGFFGCIDLVSARVCVCASCLRRRASRQLRVESQQRTWAVCRRIQTRLGWCTKTRAISTADDKENELLDELTLWLVPTDSAASNSLSQLIRDLSAVHKANTISFVFPTCTRDHLFIS